MRRYVLGFVFDFGWHNVLLIHKTKDDWQKGRMNGLGGKIEDGEPPIDAMVREFREETNNYDMAPAFKFFGRLRGDGWEVWLFHAKVMLEFPVELQGRDAGGEGTLSIVPIEDLGTWPVLPNLRYLIPMAKNHARQMDRALYFDITEGPTLDDLLTLATRTG